MSKLKKKKSGKKLGVIKELEAEYKGIGD